MAGEPGRRKSPRKYVPHCCGVKSQRRLTHLFEKAIGSLDDLVIGRANVQFQATANVIVAAARHGGEAGRQRIGKLSIETIFKMDERL